MLKLLNFNRIYEDALKYYDSQTPERQKKLKKRIGSWKS